MVAKKTILGIVQTFVCLAVFSGCNLVTHLNAEAGAETAGTPLPTSAPATAIAETPQTEIIIADACEPKPRSYRYHILGTWMMTLTASTADGPLTIAGPITFHRNGTATIEYESVSVPQFSTIIYPDGSGHWEVTGDRIDIAAGQGMWGHFSDETHMDGTIIDTQGVSVPWRAYKIADSVEGRWMMHISGWGDGEISRFQNTYLRSDGSAQADWVKVQMEDGSVHEGQIPNYLDRFTYDGGAVSIHSADGTVSFEGQYLGFDDDSCAVVMEGTWENQASGDAGTWYAVSME